MASAFWVTEPFTGSIDAVADSPLTSSEPQVRVRTLYSGVSRGTEALVFSGQVPESEYQTMRAPFQEGDFPFPVKYGYANVGLVERVEHPEAGERGADSAADSLVGQTVFCLFPHQDEFVVPASAVVPLPENLPPARAVLAANMETAVNGLWDASPRVGERIAVVGLGVVGLQVAWLANQIPGTRVTAVDVNPGRRHVAEALGLTFATELTQADHDLVIHASGHPSGLTTALSLCDNEARIIEMSWYGDQSVPAPLGQAFHSKRLTLRSSQVGQLNPAQQPRWSYRSRMELALTLLQAPVLDALITGESRFEDLPSVMGNLSGHVQNPKFPTPAETLCHRIVY